MSQSSVRARPVRLGSASPSRTSSGIAWAIVALLVLFQVFSFADKAVLGLVASYAMPELGMSAAEFGFIGGAFYMLYAVVAFVTGAVAYRVSAKWIVLVLGVIWALTQLPILFGGGAAALLITRVILGGAEGPGTPMALTSAHGWFRPEDRALPSNLIATGSTLGPVIAAPLITWVIIAWGWRWAFGVLAIGGLIWGVLWLLIGADGPFAGHRSKRDVAADAAAAADATAADVAAVDGIAADAVAAEKAEKAVAAGPAAKAGTAAAAGLSSETLKPVRIWSIVASASFVTAVLGGFSCFWSMGFLTTWFPKYLGTVVGLSTAQVGFVTTLPWIVGAVVLVGVGFLGRVWMRQGASVRKSIALPFSLLLVLAGVGLVVAALLGGGVVAVVLLVIAVGCALIFPMAPSAMAYATAPRQRAVVMNLIAGAASLGAVLSPIVVGLLMEGAGYRSPAPGQKDTPEMAAAMAEGVNSSFLLAGLILLVFGVLAAVYFKPEATAKRLQARYVAA